ncbi:MAG TPA: hypothetical protein VK688_13460 [Gemmatimonadales bacterium]|nr:hypothetical protein [Gemmatimonadales bacterium]
MGADSTGPLVSGKKALIVLQLKAILTAEVTGQFDSALAALLADSRWADKAKRVGTIITSDS